jgi:cytochrome c-type biogenesis protein CcmH
MAAPTSPARSKGRILRWGPWALLLIVAVAALAIGVPRHSHPTLQEQTTSIANAVKCPVCSGETAAQSDTAASLNIRLFIRDHLVAGESRSQILAQLSASYGADNLEKPSVKGVDFLLWAVPVLAFLAAVGGLGLVFARWRVWPAVDISDEDRSLVGGALDAPAGDDPGAWDES